MGCSDTQRNPDAPLKEYEVITKVLSTFAVFRTVLGRRQERNSPWWSLFRK